MGETSARTALPEPASESALAGSGRERATLIAFVTVAVVATLSWLVLLGWLVIAGLRAAGV